MSNLINFWKKKKNLILWKIKPKQILSSDSTGYKWFPDGKINVYENCISKYLKKNHNKKALIFYDKNKKIKYLTYGEIDILTENFCQILLKQRIKKKEVITIHASASIESAIAMLACSRIGITFSVIFEDLPVISVLKRIDLLKSRLVITRANEDNLLNLVKLIKKQNKKTQIINLNDTDSSLKNVQHIKISNLEKKKKINKKINSYQKSNHPLFILFTSGSTGNPKGIIHSSGGYLLYTKYTCRKQFGLNKNSVMFTASDAGWINGHTYALFGPLSLGATSILVEKPINILNKFFLKEILSNNKVTILYLPVTLIRLFRGLVGNTRIFKNNNISCLGSMGEPLAKGIAEWFSKTFKNNKLPIVNTYFQTETGGIISSPKYNFKKVNVSHGTVGKPVNKYLKLKIHKKDKSKTGEIKIANSWPGVLIGVINGKKYFNNYWDNNRNFKMFDIGKFNKFGLLEVYGRNDDVINIRGHRVGSGELETIILSNREVKEACVVPIEDSLEGNRLVVFYSIINNSKSKNIESKIEYSLIKNFGGFIKPRYIIRLSNLPKTKSGKILRRVLKVLIRDPEEKNIGDLSTIIDKKIIIEARKKVKFASNE